MKAFKKNGISSLLLLFSLVSHAQDNTLTEDEIRYINRGKFYIGSEYSRYAANSGTLNCMENPIMKIAGILHKNQQAEDAWIATLQAMDTYRQLGIYCPPAEALRAEIYSDYGKKDSAVLIAKKMVEKYPTEKQFYAFLGKMQIRAKNYDDAITSMKHYAELIPNDDNAYLLMGLAYYRKQNQYAATQALQKAITINPGQAYASLVQARIFIDQNKPQKSIDLLNTPSVVNANISDVFSMRAIAYWRLGNYAEALQSANEGVTANSRPGIGISLRYEEKFPVIFEVNPMGPAAEAGFKSGDKVIAINKRSTKGTSAADWVILTTSSAGTPLSMTVERNGTEIEKAMTSRFVPMKESINALAIKSVLLRYMNDPKGQQEFAMKANSLLTALSDDRELSDVANALNSLDQGRYDEAIHFAAGVKENPYARMYQALACARKGLFEISLYNFLQIPEEQLVASHVPMMVDYNTLMTLYKPAAGEHKAKAAMEEASGNYDKALEEYITAWKLSNDKERPAVIKSMAQVIAKKPSLSEMPEEVRRHSLRAEMLIKEGEFDAAIREYKVAYLMAPYLTRFFFNVAIVHAEVKNFNAATRFMQMYVDNTPDATDLREAKDQIIKWEFMHER